MAFALKILRSPETTLHTYRWEIGKAISLPLAVFLTYHYKTDLLTDHYTNTRGLVLLTLINTLAYTALHYLIESALPYFTESSEEQKGRAIQREQRQIEYELERLHAERKGVDEALLSAQVKTEKNVKGQEDEYRRKVIHQKDMEQQKDQLLDAFADRLAVVDLEGIERIGLKQKLKTEEDYLGIVKALILTKKGAPPQVTEGSIAWSIQQLSVQNEILREQIASVRRLLDAQLKEKDRVSKIEREKKAEIESQRQRLQDLKDELQKLKREESDLVVPPNAAELRQRKETVNAAEIQKFQAAEDLKKFHSWLFREYKQSTIEQREIAFYGDLLIKMRDLLQREQQRRKNTIAFLKRYFDSTAVELRRLKGLKEQEIADLRRAHEKETSEIARLSTKPINADVISSRQAQLDKQIEATSRLTSRVRAYFTGMLDVMAKLSTQFDRLKVYESISVYKAQEISASDQREFQIQSWEDLRENDAYVITLNAVDPYLLQMNIKIDLLETAYVEGTQLEGLITRHANKPAGVDEFVSMMARTDLKLYQSDSQAEMGRILAAFKDYQTYVRKKAKSDEMDKAYDAISAGFEETEGQQYLALGKKEALQREIAVLQGTSLNQGEIKRLEDTIVEKVEALKEFTDTVADFKIKIDESYRTIAVKEGEIQANEQQQESLRSKLKVLDELLDMITKGQGETLSLEAAAKQFLDAKEAAEKAEKDWKEAEKAVADETGGLNVKLNEFAKKFPELLKAKETNRKEQADWVDKKSKETLAQYSIEFLRKQAERFVAATRLYSERFDHRTQSSQARLQFNKAEGEAINAEIQLARVRLATLGEGHKIGKVDRAKVQIAEFQYQQALLHFKIHEQHEKLRLAPPIERNGIKKILHEFYIDEIKILNKICLAEVAFWFQHDKGRMQEYFDKYRKELLVLTLGLVLKRVQLDLMYRAPDLEVNVVQSFKKFFKEAVDFEEAKMLKENLSHYSYARDLDQELEQGFSGRGADNINSIGTVLEDIVARGGPIENSRVPIIKKQLELIKLIAQKPHQGRDEKIGKYKESLVDYRRARASLNSEIAKEEGALIIKQQKVFSEKTDDDSKQHDLYQVIKEFINFFAPTKMVFYLPSLALYAVCRLHVIEKIPLVKGFVSTDIAEKTWAILTVAHVILQGTFPKSAR